MSQFVDFTITGDYRYTKPVEVTWGDWHESVSTWKGVFVETIKAFFAKYPDVISQDGFVVGQSVAEQLIEPRLIALEYFVASSLLRSWLPICPRGSLG